jgi:hypothetical protein
MGSESRLLANAKTDRIQQAIGPKRSAPPFQCFRIFRGNDITGLPVPNPIFETPASDLLYSTLVAIYGQYLSCESL